jgi:hypothetical protein
MGALLDKLTLEYDGATVKTPPNAKLLLDNLYQHLTILDDKARALMTFDGIVVAGVALVVGGDKTFPPVPWLGPCALVLGAVVAVIALWSSARCLWVAKVSFPFFHDIVMTAAVPAAAPAPAVPARLEYRDGLEILEKEVIKRTKSYQIACVLALIAVPLFIITVILSVVLTILK